MGWEKNICDLLGYAAIFSVLFFGWMCAFWMLSCGSGNFNIDLGEVLIKVNELGLLLESLWTKLPALRIAPLLADNQHSNVLDWPSIGIFFPIIGRRLYGYFSKTFISVLCQYSIQGGLLPSISIVTGQVYTWYFIMSHTGWY